MTTNSKIAPAMRPTTCGHAIIRLSRSGSAEPITAVLAACGYTLGQPPVRAPEPKDGKKGKKDEQ